MTPDYLKCEKSTNDLIDCLTKNEAKTFKSILIAEHKSLVTDLTYQSLHNLAALQGAAKVVERLIDKLADK